MNSHRIGIYLEVTCPGVDHADAVNRAADSLERAAGSGYIRAYTRSGPSGEPVDSLIVHQACGVTAAARNGLLQIVPVPSRS